MKIRIYYEDTDAGGIVYHTNYIKYCERARSELFFQQNLKPLENEDSGFVVRNLNANFLSSASLGDMLQVSTELISQKKVSFVLKQTIFKEEIKIFEMDITLVYIKNKKPSKIPEKLLKIITS